MSVVWERSGDAFYATAEIEQGGDRYHLIVDQLGRGLGLVCVAPAG
jgi:hypothetical protein